MAEKQKTGRRIILADETTYENSDAGYADGSLWLYLNGVSMIEAWPGVVDPEKTATIIYEFGEDSITYTGYTSIQIIMATETGCKVCLRKAVTGNG